MSQKVLSEENKQSQKVNMSIETVNALVLAGKPDDTGLVEDKKYDSFAMVELGGKTLIERVTSTLKACSSIDKIVVAGNVKDSNAADIIPAKKSMIENLASGIEALGGEGKVLASTSDIPFITTECVEDFLAASKVMQADFVYPVVEKAFCTEKFPEMKRTYLKTAEGTVTGGNMMLVDAGFVKNNIDKIEESYRSRKHILRLARMLGISTLVRIVLAQSIYPKAAPLAFLEKTAGKFTGGVLKVYMSKYAEIAEDLDTPEELELAREILAAGKY